MPSGIIWITIITGIQLKLKGLSPIQYRKQSFK